MREIYFNVSEAGCQDSPVLIGYEGENEVTRVNVDYSEWIAEFGPGSLALEVMRSGDTAPYLATLTKEGDSTYWLVSNVDTGARGTGAAGFVYTVGNQIKKSAVFRFFVGPDVGGTPGERPDPYESLISYIERLLARTEENAAAAAESAQDAADEAGKAETARRAVEDLGVTAHEDPNGPSVEKSVDPETGAVTLDFGLTPVSVSAVNGQTGAVTLDLDDIPNGAQYARTTPAQVQQIETNKSDISSIEVLIPNQASAANQLADKSFVNSSIQTSSAHFRGNWEDWAAVPTNPELYPADDDGVHTPTSNDYMVIQDASDYPVQAGETALEGTWRFKYSGVWATNGRTGWHKEYQVNETPLTAAQLAAINSGATAELIAQISTNEEDISAINAKIPANASEANKLTDESRVHAIANAKLSFYRTAAAQDSIDAGKQSKITASGVLKGDGSGGVSSAVAGTDYATPQQVDAKYTKPADGIPSTDMTSAVQASLQKADTALQAVPDTYRTAADQDTIDAGKQAKITATGILKGDGAGGVSAAVAGTDYATPQQVDAKYTKPADGIPSTDMTAAVQASLSKADTALQEVPDTYRTAADQDVIDDAQDERIEDLEQTTTATTIGPVALATFDASAANMPLKGLTVNIEPVQSGSGDPSPDNVRPITGLTGCKLHHTGVSLIGGDAFIGYAFTKNGEKYELSYNGSGVANRASGYADISGIPAGRYVLQFLNCSYPEGIEVAFRRRTNGDLTSVGTIIGSSTSGARAFDVPANTTELQFYIVPNSTVAIGAKVTMDDAILYRNGETAEPYNGNVYDITFPSEAGTVYGGTLDVVSGKMVVDRALLTVRDTDIASTSAAGKARRIVLSGAMYTIATGYPTDLKCNYYNNFPANYSAMQSVNMSIALNRPQGDQIIIYDSSIDWTTDADFLTRLQANPLQIVYPLATPIEYQLTQQEITTLLGENNIWANRGDVTVTYGAYLETVKAYADKVGDSILSAIAPLEMNYTASRAYTVGSFLFVGTQFYKVTAAIASGDTITPDTNVIQTTIAEQLMALAAN